MIRVNSVSPQFKARTIIKNPDNLLSKTDVQMLERYGEKIGLNNDTINFSVRKINDMVKIAYNAHFSNSIQELSINNVKETPLKSNYYYFIQNAICYMRKLYENTIGV